jgi:hypothetical protein
MKIGTSSISTFNVGSSTVSKIYLGSSTVWQPSAPTGDTYFDYVTLLSHFDGADNSTTFVDSSSQAISLAAVGSAKLGTTVKKFGTAALNCASGTNANMSYPSANGNVLDIRQYQDFTSEFWLYIQSAANAAPTASSVYAIHEFSGTSDLAVNLTRNAVGGSFGKLSVTLAYSSLLFTHQTDLALSTWYHVALVRKKDVVSLYVDGVKSSSSSTQNAALDNSSFFTIGPRQSGSSNLTYFDEARVTTGIARYSDSFTPSSEAFSDTGPSLPDPLYRDVRLLMPFNGANNSTTILDVSSDENTYTVNGNAKLSTAQSKFGGSSLVLDGSSGYLQFTGARPPLVNWYDTTVAANFTVEAWVYMNAFSDRIGRPVMVGNMYPTGTTNFFWSFGPIASGAISFGWQTGVTNALTTASTISLNTWTHIAFTRSGTTLKIYINGVQSASTTTSPTGAPSAQGLVIGAHNGVVFNGYIDDLRITSGAIRYSGNFTPPVSGHPYPPF